MAPNSDKKPTPIANPAYAAGMRDIRSSNKAGTHAQGTPRERSRNANLKAAIARSRNEE